MDYIKDSSCNFYFNDDNILSTVELGGTGEIIINNHSYNMGGLGKSRQLSFIDEIELLLSAETPVPQS